MKQFLQSCIATEKKIVAASKTIVVSMISGGILAVGNAYQSSGSVDLSHAGVLKMKGVFLSGCVMAAILYLANSPLGKAGKSTLTPPPAQQ